MIKVVFEVGDLVQEVNVGEGQKEGEELVKEVRGQEVCVAG